MCADCAEMCIDGLVGKCCSFSSNALGNFSELSINCSDKGGAVRRQVIRQCD